ncbi:uracil-xanthine permease family protein [Desulfocurvibacter africanus]|uniref:uracil-xanthine permease family protein n=1 Tax=Desulfocurvibacter africanus TaxID=873 RepID=UPI0004832E4F|nr:solute carrier family 23 protein [Desulfocurvibacter africanus]
MQRSRIGHDVNEAPSLGTCIALAITHVLVIFDGIIFIPNVLGKTLNVPADTLQFITFGTILVAAVFTFLQSRRRFGIGAGFILFVGSYSAFLVCSIDAVRMGGFATLATMSLLTVPIIFLYTYFIRFFRHIITPAVGGVVILLVAVSLVPIGLEIWTGTQVMTPDMSFSKLWVGCVTAVVLTLCMLFGNTALKLWSPFISIACGYVAAALAGLLHFEHTLSAAWFGLPPLAWPGIETNITTAHLPLLFAFSMAMLASMIENTGNIMLVQQISKRDFRRVSYDAVQGGLYCDGLSKVASGLLGTAVPSIYCDNLPLIEITGVASRRIGACGGAVLLVLAFMPKVGGFMLDMPGAVLGGLLIVIAALLFHAGIGLLTINKLSNQHGLILGLSLSVGIVAESGSYFGNIMPEALAPIMGNSVALGGFTAFMLSIIAYLMPKRSVQGTFKPDVSELPKLQEMLLHGKKKLLLSETELDTLMLCCEEVFCHMLEGDPDDQERYLTFRISKVEDRYFTEVVCGHKMDDINNFAVPDSFFSAKPEELKQLGMILFSKFARDVKHLEISGYSFISFVI